MTKSKLYYVTYAVTREEVYCVQAENEDEAEQNAIEDGDFVEMGETLRVTHLETGFLRYKTGTPNA